MVKGKLYRKILSYLIGRKPALLDAVIKEAVIKYGFIPSVVSDRKYFMDWEKKGYHISQNHFYHPLPDISGLDKEYWNKEMAMTGVNLNLGFQEELLAEFNESFSAEFNSLPLYQDEVKSASEYYVQNGNFTSVDGEILYCMIRKFRPQKVIEIGAGFSSFLISKAIGTNKNLVVTYCPWFISIEPYPRPFLDTEIPFLSQMIKKRVQDLEPSFFKSLSSNDILFIDSSHVMKYGSDVEFELFDVLPSLQEGVIIHFHDVFWPKTYPEKWVKDNGWFWNEQHFLQSFLMFNDSFEILWCSSLMHLHHPAKLDSAIRSYSENENPGSLWLRKIK